MGWIPIVRVSMTVETSPGNFQFWFFLKKAVDAETAQKLGKMAGRRFGLVAVDAYEDVLAPREISNRAAGEFQELRDEIVEERAAFAAP
jgi:hypothetical protein